MIESLRIGFTCRGSLYRLLHKSGVKDIDETRRINMAFDVVCIF